MRAHTDTHFDIHNVNHAAKNALGKKNIHKRVSTKPIHRCHGFWKPYISTHGDVSPQNVFKPWRRHGKLLGHWPVRFRWVPRWSFSTLPCCWSWTTGEASGSEVVSQRTSMKIHRSINNPLCPMEPWCHEVARLQTSCVAHILAPISPLLCKFWSCQKTQPTQKENEKENEHIWKLFCASSWTV